MAPEILIAAIAAVPPTLAALLGYLGNRRAIRRSVGNSPTIPLSKVIERMETKIDHLVEGQTAIRERLARLEGERSRQDG